jgi:hypothetical protein
LHASADTTCADRFAELLALDHSRTEPWGSRHGLAFSAFVLQHPSDYPERVRAGAWRMLYRVFVHGLDRAAVVTEMLAFRGALPEDDVVPPLPERTSVFAVTIGDLEDFDAATYADRLDVWCRAALMGYGVELV